MTVVLIVGFSAELHEARLAFIVGSSNEDEFEFGNARLTWDQLDYLLIHHIREGTITEAQAAAAYRGQT